MRARIWDDQVMVDHRGESNGVSLWSASKTLLGYVGTLLTVWAIMALFML